MLPPFMTSLTLVVVLTTVAVVPVTYYGCSVADIALVALMGTHHRIELPLHVLSVTSDRSSSGESINTALPLPVYLDRSLVHIFGLFLIKIITEIIDRTLIRVSDYPLLVGTLRL
jgi:hypothetical protein